QAAQARRRVESRPESQEHPERKSEENPVMHGNATGPIDSHPVIEHPGPAFRRVQPMQGLARSGAGLRNPRVTFDRIRKVRSVGWPGVLILNQFALQGKRHAFEEIAQAGKLGADAGGPEFVRVKRIVCDRRQKRSEPGELLRLNLATQLPDPLSMACRASALQEALRIPPGRSSTIQSL